MRTSVGGEIELARFRLPVSGRMVALRPLTGAEDLLLSEVTGSPRNDLTLAITLASRLGFAIDGEPLDWSGMTVSDLDVLVIRLRQGQIGDRVRADVACPSAGCGEQIDIDFRVEDFLEHHSPREVVGLRHRHWNLGPDKEPGWYCLVRGSSGAEEVRASFRLPTVADLLAVAGRPDAEQELMTQCFRPRDLPAKLRRRAEAAMEAMAPSFCTDLQGECPECGALVTMQFDARWFCLRELRDRAAFLYPEIDLLARRYHWSETEILALPQVRRAAYAELARQDGRA